MTYAFHICEILSCYGRLLCNFWLHFGKLLSSSAVMWSDLLSCCYKWGFAGIVSVISRFLRKSILTLILEYYFLREGHECSYMSFRSLFSFELMIMSSFFSSLMSVALLVLFLGLSLFCHALVLLFITLEGFALWFIAIGYFLR